MAAAVSLARYLLNEASSGTTPTSIADDTGNGNGLPYIDYSAGDMVWTSDGAGNGLDVPVAAATSQDAVAYLADIATNGNIGSSLDAATEASIIVRGRFEGFSSGARVLFIGLDGGNGDLAIIHNGTYLTVRWDMESGGDLGEYGWTPPTDVTHTIAVVIDTTQVVANDRIKMYYDGVDQGAPTSILSAITQNTNLGNINNTTRYIALFNRPTLSRGAAGEMYYAELFTGQLTPPEISAAHTVLSANHDTDWDSGGDTTPPTINPQSFNYNENQTAGATVATVAATDDTAVTGFTFTATGTQTSSDTFFNIDNAGVLTITAAGVASVYNDFDTGLNSVAYDVTAEDAVGNSASATITLNVLDVDDTDPVLSLLTAIGVTNLAATLGGTLSEAATVHCTLYLTSEVTPPTDQEVIDGTYANAVNNYVDLVAGTAGLFAFPEVTGLTGNVSYTAKMVPVDTNSNQGSAMSIVFSTQSATVTFPNITGGANLTGLDGFVVDSIPLSTSTRLKGFSGETTDANGDLVIDLNDVSVTQGQTVFYAMTNTGVTDGSLGSGTVSIA